MPATKDTFIIPNIISKRPLICFLLFFTAGILVDRTCLLPGRYPASIAVISGLLLLSLLLAYRNLQHYLLSLIFFLSAILIDQMQHRPSLLSDLSVIHQRVIIEGTIIRPVKQIHNMIRMTVRSDRVRVSGKWFKTKDIVYVKVYNGIPGLEVGEKIRFPAYLRSFTNFKNPGAYNYRAAMKSKGYSCAAYVYNGKDIIHTGRGHLPVLSIITEHLKVPVRNLITRCLNKKDAPLFYALILGEQQQIPYGTRENFNRTGLGHMLAISGLHVGLVAWACFLLFKKLLSLSYTLMLAFNIKKIAAIMTCFPVTAYSLIAGFGISTERAMIMVMIFLFSIILNREKDIASTVALAGIIILLINPDALFSISFQMSFCAVIGILWLVPPLVNRLPSFNKHKERQFHSVHKWLRGVLYYVTGLFAVSLCATFFLLPLTTFYFHRISLVSIPANLCAVPILGLWVLPLGLSSAMILPFSQYGASCLLHLSAIGLHLMVSLIDFWAHFSWASIWVITPNLFEITLFYLLVLSVFFFRRHLWARILFITVMGLSITDTAYWIHRTRFNRDLFVTFIDAGYRNIALVEFPFGKRMIIDETTGGKKFFDTGRIVLAPFLWYSKILSIDYILTDCTKAGQPNDLDFIARNFHAKKFLCNPIDSKDSVFSKDRKSHTNENSGCLLCSRKINGVKTEQIYYLKKLTSTNSAPVLFASRLSFMGISFLFPARHAGNSREARTFLHKHNQVLKSSVLFLPYCKNCLFNRSEFLDAVNPKICIISHGQRNHHTDQYNITVNRANNTSYRTVRVDIVGATKFRVGKNGLHLNPASVEFAEDLPVPARQTGARRQGRRRTMLLQVLATQIR